MIKVFLFHFCAAVLCSVIISSCKATSYGSSEMLSHSDFYSQKENADCLAWRFTLATTLHTIIKQTTIHNRMQDDPDFHGRRLPVPKIEVDKILPAKKAKRIINTIVEKEGGLCSREILYDTPCFMKSVYTRPKSGKVHAVLLHGKIKFDYFSAITGIDMNKEKVKDFDIFLKKHISLSPDTKDFYYGISCGESCTDHILYEYYNNFGVCMFKKYQSYFKEKNIFDLAPYGFNGFKLSQITDDESLRLFIETSDKIAAESSRHQSNK